MESDDLDLRASEGRCIGTVIRKNSGLRRCDLRQ
jgi:hypothetical protein